MDRAKFLKHGGFILNPQGEGWVFSEFLGAYGEQPESGFAVYAPDFFLEVDKPWLSFANFKQTHREKLSRQFAKPRQIELNWESPSKLDFQNYFQRIQKEMKNGLQKAVPVVFEQAKASINSDKLENMLANVFAHNNAQYSYGLWNEHQGLLGRSPELLFYFRDKTLTTMALAATAPADNSESLTSNPKELKEHQIVVQDILQQLVELGETEVSLTYEHPIAQLKHLRTDIKVKLHQTLGFQNLILKLHPTSALGVFPRSYGLEFLKNLCESNVRQRFGAPFGYSHQGESLAIVAIRNIQWSQDQVYLGSGCGVVAESQVEKEWTELKLKRDSVKRALL